MIIFTKQERLELRGNVLQLASYGTVVVTSEEEINAGYNNSLTPPCLSSPGSGLVKGGEQ